MKIVYTSKPKTNFDHNIIKEQRAFTKMPQKTTAARSLKTPEYIREIVTNQKSSKIQQNIRYFKNKSAELPDNIQRSTSYLLRGPEKFPYRQKNGLKAVSRSPFYT